MEKYISPLLNELKQSIKHDSTQLIIYIYINPQTSLFNLSRVCTHLVDRIKYDINNIIDVKLYTESSKSIKRDYYMYSISVI